MLPVKRVPIPVVILLSLGAVALPWWLGTRHMDFLKPPTEFQLTRLRSDVVSSFPKRSGSTAEPRSPELERAIQSPIKPAPMIDPDSSRIRVICFLSGPDFFSAIPVIASVTI